LSGGSESDNLGIKGLALGFKEKGNHIITSTLSILQYWEHAHICLRMDLDITYVKVDKNGFVDPNEVEKAITNKTILVSIMHRKQRDWNNPGFRDHRPDMQKTQCFVPFRCSPVIHKVRLM